jgi:hypothetical protein
MWTAEVFFVWVSLSGALSADILRSAALQF